MSRYINTSLFITRNDDTNTSLWRLSSSVTSYIGVCGYVRRLDKYRIFRTLDDLKYKFHIFRIVYESESLVGKISDKWARDNGILSVSERVRWIKYGPSAKVIRNEHILNRYSPFLILNFAYQEKYPDLFIRAKRNNINTFEISL